MTDKQKLNDKARKILKELPSEVGTYVQVWSCHGQQYWVRATRDAALLLLEDIEDYGDDFLECKMPLIDGKPYVAYLHVHSHDA